MVPNYEQLWPTRHVSPLVPKYLQQKIVYVILMTLRCDEEQVHYNNRRKSRIASIARR
jgi:hypothetical protein